MTQPRTCGSYLHITTSALGPPLAPRLSGGYACVPDQPKLRASWRNEFGTHAAKLTYYPVRAYGRSALVGHGRRSDQP
jgi:hypothetical protein